MSFPKTSRLILAVVCGLPIFNIALRADEQSADSQPAATQPAETQPAATQPEAPQPAVPTQFATSIRTGETIGFEQVRRVNITAGTNQFAFVVPRGINLRVDASNPEKITITSADCSYFVTLRILPGTAQGLGEAEATSFFRNMVLSQYDGASGLEESTLSADGQSGPAFDASWYVGSTSTRRIVRVAFIPTQAGTLECSLVADPKKSSEAKSALSAVLLTLRSNKYGKLENLVLMDKS